MRHCLLVGMEYWPFAAIQSFTKPAMFAVAPLAGSVVLKSWRVMSVKDSPGSGLGVAKGLGLLEAFVTG